MGVPQFHVPICVRFPMSYLHLRLSQEPMLRLRQNTTNFISRLYCGVPSPEVIEGAQSSILLQIEADI